MNEVSKKKFQILAAGLLHLQKWFKAKFIAPLDRLIPGEFFLNPELVRQARLVANFGLLGSIFGLMYAVFYMLIEHSWGALIILICSSLYVASPSVMRRRHAIEPAANLLLFTFISGFISLCIVEGGLQGHAIAWLVIVPLLAFLLLGEKWAIRWSIAALIATAMFPIASLAGVKFVPVYDPRWNLLVSSAGYLGLIIFMFILGFLFERGRTRAFTKMQDALANLARSNERLVHLNQEKNEFLGIAAHDLKNPLTAIMGNAEMAAVTFDRRQLGKLLHNISDAADRMHGLIVNLLDINTIEQDGFRFKIESCNVHELIRQSVEDNQLASNRKLIDVRVGASLDFFVNADRSGMLQILDNLISNAVKYSLPKSNVQIHVMQEAQNILIAVRDEGPGISESDQKRLFQKFTRLSARPTGGESSTGLGLAIVKRLAEAMSGAIECKSVPGSGSTFTLALPSAPAPVPASKALPPVSQETHVRSTVPEVRDLPEFRN